MASSSKVHQTSSRDNWMVTYGSLLTGVLAFFLLLVGKSTSESESIFRFTDNLTAHLGDQINEIKAEEGYDWLYVENTGNRGIKLLIPSEIDRKPMFFTGQAQINEGFIPVLKNVATALNRTDLPRINELYEGQIRQLQSIGNDIDINVRIEGHTDQRAISTADFRDNWDLSTARAYSVMLYFQKELDLAEKFFSMAGYAYFHPLHDIENYDENRRVEIYLKVNTVNKRELN